MTWHISASGHTPAPPSEPGHESPGWAHVEQKLFDELQHVLSKPEYGCSVSDFHGNYVDGNPHVRPGHATHEHVHDDTGDEEAST